MTKQGSQGSEGSGSIRSDELAEAIVRNVEAQGVLPKGVSAKAATVNVLCVLMRRLSRGEAKDLLESLPLTLASLLGRCAFHTERPELLKYGGFVTLVAEHLGLFDLAIADRVARAVFAAVKTQLDTKEIGDVKAQLPKDLQNMWMEPMPPIRQVDEQRRAKLGLTPDPLITEIESRGPLPEDIRAADAASAVLCVLTERLSGGEARDLLEELPGTLRSVLSPCALHAEESEVFDREVFLIRVGQHLNVERGAAEEISRRVFAAVKSQLPPKEVKDIDSQVPHDLRELWRSAA